MSTFTDLEAIAATLEASGDYKVLRRLKPRRLFTRPRNRPRKIAIFVDLETTGLDPDRDEIIEIAMVAFTYSVDGVLFQVTDVFQGFREPAVPIPPEVTALTGIDEALVRGRSIDPQAVAAFVKPANLVIAHNAAFDRKFAERFADVFVRKPWACSMTEVPWEKEGYEGTRLKYLAMSSGFFFDGHRATEDCFAALELLARPLPRSGVSALAKLLEQARQTMIRVCAEGAPFESKDLLKGRGYRWNDGMNGGPRAWWKDVVEEEVDQELKFLRSEIYGRYIEIPTRRITAYDRYSSRDR